MLELATINRSDQAIELVKKRFVRLPSPTSYPRFRDIEYRVNSSDVGLVFDWYKKNGGKALSKEQLIERLDYVYTETFRPLQKAIIKDARGDQLNLWSPHTTQYSGKRVTVFDVSPFMNFMNRLFPIPNELNFFMKLLAHTIRRPDQRITITPILRSEPGVGKGFLGETLLAGLMSKEAAGVCGIEHLTGTHNGVLEGKTVLMIDEVQGVSLKAAQVLKSLIGNLTIPLRRMQRDTVVIDNYVNFILTSNFENPIQLEASDRRYWIPQFIQHQTSKEETMDFINKELKPWFLKGGNQLVRDYLETIDLTEFRPGGDAPMTDSKRELLGVSEDGWEAQVQTMVEQYKVLSVKAIRANGISEEIASGVALPGYLEKLRCQLKPTNEGKLYITPQGIKSGLSKDSTPKELKAYLPRW